MDWKERPAVVAIFGLAILFISSAGAIFDIREIAEGLRKMTGLNWQWWNIVGIAIGLAMVVWGLYHRKHFRTDGDAEPPQERKIGNMFERFILTPLTYPIILLHIFSAWSFAEHEDDPMGVLKRLIFFFTVVVLGLTAFIFLITLMIYAVANLVCLFDQGCVTRFIYEFAEE